MPLPYANPAYSDKAHTVATPMGLPVFSSGVPNTTDEHILTQEFYMARSKFTPLALNTPHQDYPDFVLTSESEKQDMLGAVVKWTREYRKVPDSYSDQTTYSYHFIGFQPDYYDGTTTLTPGRIPFHRTVPCRLLYEFFLTDPSGTVINPSDGKIYKSPDEIPVLSALLYYNVDEIVTTNNPTPWVPVDFVIWNIPPNTHPASSPKLSSYKAWIKNAQTHGFAGDVVTNGQDPDGFNPNTKNPTLISPSQFLVEDSRLTRWSGNIWMRTSMTILAR